LASGGGQTPFAREVGSPVLSFRPGGTRIRAVSEG
jgi:hypothetical protein